MQRHLISDMTFLFICLFCASISICIQPFHKLSDKW